QHQHEARPVPTGEHGNRQSDFDQAVESDHTSHHDQRRTAALDSAALDIEVLDVLAGYQQEEQRDGQDRKSAEEGNACPEDSLHWSLVTAVSMFHFGELRYFDTSYVDDRPALNW